MLGSAKTSFKHSSCRLQGLRVSTIQSLSRVLICINETMPMYERLSWCSKSMAISLAILSSFNIAASASGVSTKVAVVVSKGL